jgi:hypothetical protein
MHMWITPVDKVLVDILWVTFAYPGGPCGAIEYIYVPSQAQNRVKMDPKIIKRRIPV